MNKNLLLLLSAAVLLPGCGDDASTASTTPTTVAPAPTVAETTTTASTNATTTVAFNAEDYVKDGDFYFQTADKAVRCMIAVADPAAGTPIEASCELADSGSDIEWPAKPADCDTDWGGAITVDRTNKASLGCHGGVVVPFTGKVLPEGQTLGAKNHSCSVADNRVTCRSLESGHEFSLSARDFKLG